MTAANQSEAMSVDAGRAVSRDRPTDHAPKDSEHSITAVTQSHTGQDTAVRASCLQRLATALSGYRSLDVTVRPDGPAPCLAVRNTAAPLMSETVTVGASGDDLAYIWSWGAQIGDASDPDGAAHAIAHVLAAPGARLGR